MVKIKKKTKGQTIIYKT